MAIIIAVPTPLRQYAGGNSEVRVEAETAGEALAQLTAAYGDLRKHLYTDQNTLRNFVNVYVNEEDIRHGAGPATAIKDGDTIMIVPAIAGGQTDPATDLHGSKQIRVAAD